MSWHVTIVQHMETLIVFFRLLMNHKFNTYIHTYMCIICIYIYIKNFAWEDQRWKQCCIVHIALRGVNSATLFVYRTGYVYGKEPEGFQRFFSALSILDKMAKC